MCARPQNISTKLNISNYISYSSFSRWAVCNGEIWAFLPSTINMSTRCDIWVGAVWECRYTLPLANHIE